VSKQKTTKAKTSRSLPVFIADTTSTTGGGLSGVTHTSSGLVLEYRRQNQSTWTSVTPVSKTLGTYVSGGIVADGSLAGAYEVDFPDAAFASAAGVEWVALRIRGVANMLPVLIEIELDAVDYQDSAAFGLSRIDATISSRATVDAVWDEVLTGATHNIASSAGRRLRQLASVIVRAGTAQGPGTGNNQIQLDAGASATNGEYDPGLIFIETGTGAGQARLILQYTGSTKVATVDRDWRINPDNTSEFVILADAGRNSVNEGLAQGGTSTTITLNASASASDDAYNGQLVFIRSGTGQDQVGLVEDYVGSTKVATIRTRSATGQWATVPDTTSAYMMIPNLTFTLSEISGAVADGVWDEATSGHTTAGTTGKALIDSGAAGNPWSTDLATGYSGTQAGNILNNVKSQTDLIQAGGTVNVTTPVTASGQLASPLIIGDDYLAANGRRFRWTVELPSGYVIATSTARFGMRYEDEQGINSFIATGTVTDATGGNVHLDFDVAKTVTGTLRPGWYEWSVEIVSAIGTEITRVKSGKNAEWQEKQT
jgi:hypothetical protein